MSKKILLSFTILLIVFLLVFGCTKKPPTVPVYNQPPETYLVNIPYYSPDSTDTIYADTTYIYHATVLFWYGTDVDGRVTRYDWAIDDTVYSENIAGSGWHSLYMDSTLATRDIIAFAAPLPDTLYTHTFYVRAVDNDEAPDPSPSHRVFNTSNIPPNTRFVSTPPDSSQRFILPSATDKWSGINFEWTAIDSDKVFPAQFQYCWDDTTINFDPVTHKGWSDPTSEESFYFTGENAPFTEDTHRVYIRAIDDAGAVDNSLCDTLGISEIDSSVTPWDTTYAIYNQWKTIVFVIPQIGVNSAYRNLLWVNLVTNGYINGNIVKPFYHSILDDSIGLAYDSLDYTSAEFDHIKLGQYSTLIWSRGDKDGSATSLQQKENLLADFLQVGGKIIFTGSAILKTGKYAENESFGIRKPFPFSELHIDKYKTLNAGTATDTSISPVESDTAFFSENSTFPQLSLNSSLLWHPIVDFQVIAEVMSLDLWGEYDGNLDIIYSLNHYRDNAVFERQPCGTRYIHEGTTIPSFFYLGFPMSYLQYGKAAQLMRIMLTELDEMP